MKRKRHTEEQIDPEGARGRREDGGSVPQARDQRSELLQTGLGLINATTAQNLVDGPAYRLGVAWR
jgi:hypothetical protein